MAHAGNIVHPAGPDSPHAFDNVSLHTQWVTRPIPAKDAQSWQPH